MQPTARRLLSVDVFRGATVAAMILVNNPGDWGNLYWPLAHVPWHGASPTDYIFPFFLFVVGIAICFSAKATFGAAARRAAILIGLGLFMAAFPFFQFATLRWPGVLQRIGVCYLAAWLIHRHGGRVGTAIAAALLVVGYAWAMLSLSVPGIGPANLEPGTNLGAWIDRLFLDGHMWRQSKTWDPEGLFSTLPAIGTTLLGVLAGDALRAPSSPRRKALQLALGGIAIMAAGALWARWFPLNKSLWSSSYVLFTCGLAAACIALLYWFIDVRGFRSGIAPALSFGRNAILVFVASGLVNKSLALIHPAGAGTPSLQAILYRGLFTPWLPPQAASLAYAATTLLLWYLLLRWLDRRGIRLSI